MIKELILFKKVDQTDKLHNENRKRGKIKQML